MNNGQKQALIVLLGFAILGSAGCTTMQTIHASEDALTQEKVQPGDKITLHYADGTVDQMTLTNIDATGVAGTTKDGRVIVAEYADIAVMEHKDVQVGKAVGATLGGFAMGALMVAEVLAAAGL